MTEYINNNRHTVYVIGPDGKSRAIKAGERAHLPPYFERYLGAGQLSRFTPTTIQKPIARRPVKAGAPRAHTYIKRAEPERVKAVPAAAVSQQQVVKVKQKGLQSKPTASRRPINRKVVGRRKAESPKTAVGRNYQFSNDIGVGILSFNRPDALRRLVDSIRSHTNLRRTTVFISDDGSTDQTVINLLDMIKATGDFVVLHNQQRLGVAGNTNRLMRCLKRFKHSLILNDDVQILKTGWDKIYPEAAASSGISHFCMQQPGVYGAKIGKPLKVNGTELLLTEARPHGAILYYNQDLFNNIGFFDEAKFGEYGLEHVDWSNRAAASRGHSGFHDVPGSVTYFKIHAEKSAVPDRTLKLHESQPILAALSPNRGYVQALQRSQVPAISVVIPCRGTDRAVAIGLVVESLIAQRFPEVEVIISEHDCERHILGNNFKHVLSTRGGNGPFNKSIAFNAGVGAAAHDDIVLHDADMIMRGNYLADVCDTLRSHDSCHLGQKVIYSPVDQLDQIGNARCVPDEVGCEHVVEYFEGGSIGCKKTAYCAVGGFDERFIGYGVEDCEFYQRLSANTNWCEDRKHVLLHLWHGRADGWTEHHAQNKLVLKTLEGQPIASRMRSLRQSLIQHGFKL